MLIPLLGLRAAKGLVIRVRERRVLNMPPGGRSITLGTSRVKGRCRWCFRYIFNRRRSWHEDCVIAHFIASGNTRRLYVVVQPYECAMCKGSAQTLDHKLPLRLAALREPDEWLRAWHVRNLQWLCYACHDAKTKKDMGDIAKEKVRKTGTELRRNFCLPYKDHYN